MKRGGVYLCTAVCLSSPQAQPADHLVRGPFLRAMNKQRKKILLAYIVFLCLIILFFFIIISYAIYQKHISGYADIFHKEAYKEEVVWIKLAIIALVNLFVFSSIIFVGLLIFLKRKNNS
jgi:TRAP-type C4-dicarboxylate transport system permease small subunit